MAELETPVLDLSFNKSDDDVEATGMRIGSFEKYFIVGSDKYRHNFW